MLPHWSALAQEIVLVRPPSAAAEKVFPFFQVPLETNKPIPSRIISRLPLWFRAISDELSVHFRLMEISYVGKDASGTIYVAFRDQEQI